MGPNNYEMYGEFGTELDQNGKALEAGNPKPVDKLRTDDRMMDPRVLDGWL